MLPGRPADTARNVVAEVRNMGILELAIAALVIAVVAGLLGFSGVAAGAATAARWLFGIFLVLAVVFFIMLALGVTVLF